ncbi:hypothetical protein ACOMHN_045852 [Nucella lapillus]
MKSLPNHEAEPPYIALVNSDVHISHILHIKELTEADITKLVLSLGFYRKSDPKDLDPDEYDSGIPSPPTMADRLKKIKQTKKFSGIVEKLKPLPAAEDVITLDRIAYLEAHNRVLNFFDRMKMLKMSRDEL